MVLLVFTQCAAVRTYRLLMIEPPHPSTMTPFESYRSTAIQGYENTLVRFPNASLSSTLSPQSLGRRFRLEWVQLFAEGGGATVVGTGTTSAG